MTELELQRVGDELVTWLRAILAGAPGSAARFVADPAALAVSARWDTAGRAVTLVVVARDRADLGRVVGRRRGVRDPLEALAQRLGERLGLLIRIEIPDLR